ncbi:MAG: hypothetical protein HC800_11475 [Phormidesmis sp. RL_2_1]|nr:hypothetical protein [Phormidesmis sp. RL_2_1]
MYQAIENFHLPLDLNLPFVHLSFARLPFLKRIFPKDIFKLAFSCRFRRSTIYSTKSNGQEYIGSKYIGSKYIGAEYIGAKSWCKINGNFLRRGSLWTATIAAIIKRLYDQFAAPY